MLENFLDQTCNITRKETSNIDGIIKTTKTEVYSGISCYSYNYKWTLEDTEIALNTSKEVKKVLIEPDKVNIKQWDILELIDTFYWNFWKYEILLNPKPNYLISGDIDSIELLIRQV